MQVIQSFKKSLHVTWPAAYTALIAKLSFLNVRPPGCVCAQQTDASVLFSG